MKPDDLNHLIRRARRGRNREEFAAPPYGFVTRLLARAKSAGADADAGAIREWLPIWERLSAWALAAAMIVGVGLFIADRALSSGTPPSALETWAGVATDDDETSWVQ